MKIIDLIGLLISNETMPKRIIFEEEEYCWDSSANDYICNDHDATQLFNNQYNMGNLPLFLGKTVEILEEEKKIPEKHINNYGDLIILGQQDNWTQKFNIKTKEMETSGIELNPYVFKAINENFKDIENKIYEIIDYLKSKGE